MTKTLQAALAPLMIVGSFCSVGLFEYPLGHSWSYLSCLYALAIWSFLTYSVYYPVYSAVWGLTHLAVLLVYFIITIGAITSVLASFFYSKELKMCLHELSLVDDIMEAVGAPKEYQRSRKWIIRITILWIVYVFQSLVHLTYFNWFFLHLGFYEIYEICMMNYPYFLHFLSALICGTILGYTSSRFHQVNDRLHVLYSDLFENISDYRGQNRSIVVCQRITETVDRKQYMWILM
ncbi:hypothetical protein ALC60_06447 [Trachymyrmex zeteki]|uniref:Gustatory receptor n=1 Tax=Mycetomoellerius zeteki TaxID=64791 RepID=A0A151X380_9HYME|nr:hypothetical protein ALC60_06447 [Trachymyrmex zeteki]